MKTLNDKELIQIHVDDLEVELCTEKLKSVALKMRTMELSQRILSMELNEQKALFETRRVAESEAKVRRAEHLKIIAKKRNLKDGWGFHPDSGEIVEK